MERNNQKAVSISTRWRDASAGPLLRGVDDRGLRGSPHPPGDPLFGRVRDYPAEVGAAEGLATRIIVAGAGPVLTPA